MSEQPASRPGPKPLRDEPTIPVEFDDLMLLAHRYTGQGMYDEAIHLYEMAAKLRPGSAALKIRISRVQDLRREAEERRWGHLRETVVLERGREEIDAAQYVGLAQFYMAKDQTAKAVELLELAKAKTPSNYRPYHILAQLYFSQGEWELARQEIEEGRRLNPFDRGQAELSGRVFFELKEFERSLDEFIDSFLLSTDQKGEGTESLRRMINTVRKVLDLDTKDLNARIRKRVDALQANTEKMDLRKEHLLSKENRPALERISAKVARDLERRNMSVVVARELRELEVLEHLDEQHLLLISRFVKLRDLLEGEVLFRENDRSMDFYVVKKGSVEVRKETPFGPQRLASIGVNEVLGEMNFIDRTLRSTDAVALEPATCYSFSFSAVDLLMEEHADLAVGLHWAFWRSLSVKVREANEQLKSFFQEDGAKQPGRRKGELKRESEAQHIRVASEDKVGLFRERGLSAAEMKLLATFSSEERFVPGAMVFREGEKGDKLYIVLDGRVRISKFIPGVGEEALAVLDRGDFFGEMALIDDKPRSADAKAHETGATVLSIDRTTLREVLSMDPGASLQFLSLLCRMISHRLREINDKIVQWKFMSGGF
ncbi:MAG TPA: cyclic nucleotide-binding domain-containing protein [Thermoanaerobaculia bacterium]|nr:cyclic nucleotide-binding domain-containing protein [Thermoanaerobaculia bacterium]